MTACSMSRTAPQNSAVYLSDNQDLIISAAQGWGELGIDVPAHATTPAPGLKIGNKSYVKGLGSHAPGEIIIDLSHEYSFFICEVGVQQQYSREGSVVFKVFVDDKLVFNSGIMRQTDPARPVSIPVSNADELKLTVTDAGDGITCDCANWAEARLVPDSSKPTEGKKERLDVGQFARVLTWDPQRMDGARNGRTEEFDSKDLFPGVELFPDAGGVYEAARYKDGTACIGLEWIERRRPKTLTVRFADKSMAPPIDGIRLEGWFSGSSLQGLWEPLTGELRAEENQIIFDLDWKSNPKILSGVLKARWLFPASTKKLAVHQLLAYTNSRWATRDIHLSMDKALPKRVVGVSAYNCEIIGKNSSVTSVQWDTSQVLSLKILCGKSTTWKGDRPVIRIKLPSGAFGIALDDLLANGCVYVREFGLFAACDAANITLSAYKRKIKGRKTVLERVRKMPDQTLKQAINNLHRPEADLGPTMLSLACDNHKYILSRDGSITWEDNPEIWNCYSSQPPCANYSCRFKPEFGTQGEKSVSRHLLDGWLPIPVITVKDGGVTYRQRTFVAPFDMAANEAGTPAWFNRKPLCVAEIDIENPQPKPADVSLKLTFLADIDKNEPARMKSSGGSTVFYKHDKPTAIVNTTSAPPLKNEVIDGTYAVSGKLPAKSHTRFLVYIPGWDISIKDATALEGSDKLLAVTKDYWHKLMAPSLQVRIPDTLLMNIVRASQVHCLLAARNEGGVRIAPWISSWYYGPLESEGHSIIRGMQFMGHTDFARRALDYYIHRYNSQGFLTTGYTVMGTGWHLWTLGEYYKLTHESDWLKEAAPEISRVCRWVIQQREKTMKRDAHNQAVPEYGLMPPGVMADWGVYSYYMYLNGYYAAGLRAAGEALADIGSSGAKSILKGGLDLGKEIMRAFHWTQSLSPVLPIQDGTWVRAYPTQVYSPCPVRDLFPGDDGGRSWAYDVELGAHHLVPFGIMDAKSPEALAMINHMEDVQFLQDGWFYYPAEKNRKDWFNFGGFAKMQPYYARAAEVLALQDDVKPYIRSYFNTLPTLLNTEDLSLWEHFFNGAYNKTHETGYFLYQTRTMLLTERGDSLWIAPFVTNEWMKDGQTISIQKAPSNFGEVNYRITSHVGSGYIEAVIESPQRRRPNEIVLRLRHPDEKPMRKVTVNGNQWARFDPKKECISLEPQDGEIVVRADY